MTLYATIEIPEDTTLPPHCADLQSLMKKLAQALMTCAQHNTLVSEAPRVCVTEFDPTPICGACAAPLLTSGKCSSPNCKFGRIAQRKPAKALGRTIPARLLAQRLGVKLGSQLKAHA